MRTWLIIGLLTAGFLQSVPKQADKPNANQDNGTQIPNPPPKPTVESNLPLAGPSPQKEENRTNAEAKQSSWREKLFAPILANWPLIAVAIWGIWVARGTLKIIARQAVSMRRQTTILRRSVHAARKGAEAALLSAQAVINAERPWLDVVSNFPPHSPLRFFECFNRGNTPARLITATADHRFVAQIEDLPAIPEYSNPIIWPDSHLLVRDDSIQLRPSGVNPDEVIQYADMRALVDQSRQFLVYYGHIIYRDTLYPESSPEGIHSTRWCYVWRPVERRFVKSGPRGYNEYT